MKPFSWLKLSPGVRQWLAHLGLSALLGLGAYLILFGRLPL